MANHNDTQGQRSNGHFSGDVENSGWTANQTREYNNLIHEQLGGGAYEGDAFDNTSVGSLGSIPLRSSDVPEPHDRPGSAPPPPGFVAPNINDRNRRAEEAIFGTAIKDSSSISNSANLDLIHHSAPHMQNGGLDDDGYSGVTGDSDSTGRGFNMNNLVEALGSDMVEDASSWKGENADRLLSQKFEDNPNYTRQTKHTTLRFIGAPGPAMAAPGVSAFGPSFGVEQSRLFGASQETSASAGSGFPSTLSSPPRINKEGNFDQAEVARRSTTPVQMHPSQTRGFPHSGDIGMSVNEPNDGDNQFSSKHISPGIISKRINDESTGAGADFYINYGNAHHPSTLNSESKEFRPSGYQFNESNEGVSGLETLDGGMEVSAHQCEADLDPFLWEVGGRPQTSRCIAILHASWIKAQEVRSECEQFGALESFRAEFAQKGVFFASFYDIRSANLAATELQTRLHRIVQLRGSREDVMVRFCFPLNSSSQHDESQIVLTGLPDNIGDQALSSMLRSYGAIRACVVQGQGSYLVEFQNLQDARQAILELESTQPWGSGVSIDPGTRNPADRRKGRELLSIISGWRQGMNRQSGTQTPSNLAVGSSASQYPAMSPAGAPRGFIGQPHEFGGVFGGSGPDTVTQLIMGPDGRYTPVVVRNPMGMPPQGGQYAVDPRAGQQQVIHGPNGQIFISSVQSPHMQGGGYQPNVVSTQIFSGNNRRGGGGTPYYDHSVVSDNISVHSGRSHGTHGTGYSHHSTGEDKDNRHLLLDLDAVEQGRDSRTSLMVRNIPNKYTQQMLLSEFTENGHGPGVIDFFYLPIDFKNRCNRGYAFINFVNSHDILAFHRRYYGKQWRTFNSDKICDITYARIQGKAAMLKRFENSALMDKDDEYKPLVFASDGPDKGKRLPFAENPANKST